LSDAVAERFVKPTIVTPMLGAEMLTVGAVVSWNFVVPCAAEDCAEVFPAESNAETVYVYVVCWARPVSVNDVALGVPTCTPFLKILYPVTPTLSVLAVQEIEAVLVVVPVTVRPVGVLDAVTSGLLTVTVRAEVFVLFDESVAFAVIVCEPFARRVVFQLKVQLVVPAAETNAPPSIDMATEETETLSDAVPEMDTVPFTVAPEAGFEIATVGGVTSATTLFTVTLTFAELPTFPAASYALVESVCAAFVAAVVFQLHVYGDVVSVCCNDPSR
jgi:hypothetical protein